MLNGILCSSVLRRDVDPPPRLMLPYLALLPPSPSPTPPVESLRYLVQLLTASRDSASGLIVSSLIAGKRSEAEDYGDVPFWIGELDESRLPEVILERLGIQTAGEVYFHLLIRDLHPLRLLSLPIIVYEYLRPLAFLFMPSYNSSTTMAHNPSPRST